MKLTIISMAIPTPHANHGHNQTGSDKLELRHETCRTQQKKQQQTRVKKLSRGDAAPSRD
jgi:hypothetical protein